MCEWFEDGVYTLGELQQYLKDISKADDNTYHTRFIKTKIIERYGEEHVSLLKFVDEVMLFASVKWLTTQ